MTPADLATDAHFGYYQLLLRPASTLASPAPWTEISRGLSAVTNATLGTLDPTRLANGAWELGLRVVDVNGQETSTVVPLEIARDLKLGQLRLSFTDIRSDAAGLLLVLTRTYDSARREEPGDFGWGWSASAQDLSVRKNMVLGLNWANRVATTKRRPRCRAGEGGLPCGHRGAGSGRFGAQPLPLALIDQPWPPATLLLNAPPPVPCRLLPGKGQAAALHAPDRWPRAPAR